MQLVREATAAAVGAASALVGEAPVLAGLGVTKGLAVEIAAVAAGVVLDTVIATPHAKHAGNGLLNGGVALLARRLGLGFGATAPLLASSLQASLVRSDGYRFV